MIHGLEDLDIADTLPLSRELNEAVARERDEEARLEALRKHDSRCGKCGELMRAREFGSYDHRTGKLAHAVCPRKGER